MGEHSLYNFDNEFLLEVIDGSSAYMYIMDPETYEILYMNEALCREFNLKEPAGQICWKVLQKDMNGPCDFCSIPSLLESKERSCFWENLNSVTGRVYQNFDRIIEHKGKSYFIRCSSDMTDLTLLSQDASLDDLTGMLNRRAGQRRLEELLDRAGEEKETLSIALCDINELKQVNDLYGHLEGDKVIRYFADVVKSQAETGDLVFRLSGDEFILASYGKRKEEIETKILRLERRLQEEREKRSIFYHVSCSFGVAEASAASSYTLKALIAIADQRMYEQKRQYHLQREKEKRISSVNSGKGEESFAGNGDVCDETAGVTDHLTGLYNRCTFEGTIKKMLADDPDRPLCIVILDIDAFKHINDLYDEDFGDEILRITAGKIQAMLPPEAGLFRLDGARYGALFPGSNEEAGLRLFNRIQNTFCRRQEYHGKTYFYTISAGCVTYPEHGANHLKLLKRANHSLEYSKSRGKNRITVFSSELVEDNERKLTMIENLRACVEDDFAGFSVVFQPQVEAETGKIYGAEALSRWQSDRFGSVSPLEFIPLMEQNGMISALGRWVFKKAAVCCKKWRQEGHDLHMSVNFSYPQLLDVGFAEYMREVLKEINLEPEKMILELTESYLVRNDEGLKRSLQKIMEIGVQLALDDFGTGYSSILSLSKLPATTVKIDKGFAKDIDTNVFNKIFVNSITDLCHSIGKSVCLEGVETEAQSRVAREKGIELVQGFYYGYPETEEEFKNKYL